MPVFLIRKYNICGILQEVFNVFFFKYPVSPYMKQSYTGLRLHQSCEPAYYQCPYGVLTIFSLKCKP